MQRRSKASIRQSALTWLAVAGLVALQLQFVGPVSRQAGLQATPVAQSSADAAYAHLPLAFEPNQGQAGDGVDFVVHHGQAVTAFGGTSSTTSVGGKQITMSLNGANSSSFTGQDELPSKTNYFLGNDQSQWHSDIPNFQKLLAKNVYAGIDLAYYGMNSSLEHDFIVNPGSDYHQIAFNFSGQDGLLQDKDGNLVLKAGDDQLQLNAPTTYQLGDHEKHTIPSHFELTGNTVTVAVAPDYDPTKPLVIDPTLSLIYSTYLGGSGTLGTQGDQAYGIAVDPSGFMYVAGFTNSTDFPTSSPFQGTYGGGNDAFVVKFNQAGSALVYSTFIGGTGNDQATGIAIDFVGNAYITGNTNSASFPTASPFQAADAGSNDAFLTKLNASGSSLVYSTYLGSSGSDQGYKIAVDSSNAAYVVGYEQTGNFPTASPFQASNAGGLRDAFLTKFNPGGSTVAYSTYLGGNGDDEAQGLAVDSSGNAYVSGFTSSTNFPTSSPFQAANAGSNDVFLTKFNPAGSTVAYSTYLGGSGDDQDFGVALDVNNNPYLTGYTASTNFPTASPFQSANAGSNDIFISKFNASASSLVFSTYYGGSGDDQAVGGAALDSSANVYVAGTTTSTDFPLTSPYQSVYGGAPRDAFVTKLSSSGSSVVYSTYLGGSEREIIRSIQIGLNGNLYLTGHTRSSDFPTFQPFQASYAGGQFDGIVAQLTEHTVNLTARVNPTLTFTVGSTTCALGTLSATQTQQCTYTLTAATNGTSGYSISYLPAATLTSGANTITALTSPTASTLNTEQFGINLAANTAAGSHTASNFGAAPSGGSGTASSNYTTSNLFKLNAAGETIATATSPSLTTTYTVSTIANITNTTEAGAYTTTFTYNIVSTY